MNRKQHYQGFGQQQSGGWKSLPVVNPESLRDPEHYLASRDLATAVNVALTLGMPLLLTGEPGSGKSRLAHSIAWELDLGDPHEFVVKSDTQGKDLFYSFDTVGRFHASQVKQGEIDPRQFLTFNALGKALLYAKSAEYLTDILGIKLERIKHPKSPRRSVVLIDGIDKAPRDVPNDLLTEIEQMRFRIPEIESVKGLEDLEIGLNNDEQQNRPIVVITSNSEKSLPDAFLRRCVYFHLSFPKFKADLEADESADQAEVTVERIVEERLGHRYQGRGATFVRDALSLFRFLRLPGRGLVRPPSLAELLNWLDYLLPIAQGDDQIPSHLHELEPEPLALSIKTTLFKQKDDQGRAEALLQEWRKQLEPVRG